MLKFRLVASYNAMELHGSTQHLKLVGENTTLCGRDASDWMDMKEAELSDVESAWTCKRCQKKWAEMPVA